MTEFGLHMLSIYSSLRNPINFPNINPKTGEEEVPYDDTNASRQALTYEDFIIRKALLRNRNFAMSMFGKPFLQLFLNIYHNVLALISNKVGNTDHGFKQSKNDVFFLARKKPTTFDAGGSNPTKPLTPERLEEYFQNNVLDASEKTTARKTKKSRNRLAAEAELDAYLASPDKPMKKLFW